MYIIPVLILRFVCFGYIIASIVVGLKTIADLSFNHQEKPFRFLGLRIKLVLMWPVAIFNKKGRKQLIEIFA